MAKKWFTNIASQKETKSLYSMKLSRHFSQSGQRFILALRAACSRSDESLRKEIRTFRKVQGYQYSSPENEAIYRRNLFLHTRVHKHAGEKRLKNSADGTVIPNEQQVHQPQFIGNRLSCH
jgi:hypothetical protein